MTYTLGEAYRREVNPDGRVDVNRWIGRTGDPDLPASGWEESFEKKPDILDLDRRWIFEIKPDNPDGLSEAQSDLRDYLDILNNRRYPNQPIPFSKGWWQPRQATYRVRAPAWLGLIPTPWRIRARMAEAGVILWDPVDIDRDTMIAIAVAELSYQAGRYLVSSIAGRGVAARIGGDTARQDTGIAAAILIGVMIGF